MATILQAKYDYRSGNVLLLPKTGFAPGLFLEFIQNLGRAHINILSNSNDNESDYFIIKMPFELTETFKDAVEYINNNLPKD